MLTHENLIVFLYALPAYQLLFFTVQLITFKKAFPSRKYLGLLLLNMSIVLVLNIIHHLGYTHLMATLHIFFSPLLLNILPVFFLYLYSLTSENHEVKGSSRFILFIFPVLGLLLNVFTFGFLPFHERFLMIAGKDPAVGEMVTGIFQVARVIGIWSGPILFAVQWIVAFLLGRSLVKSQKQARQADPGHSAYLQPLWMKVVAISVILFILAIFIPLILHSGSQMEWTIISNILLLLSGGMTGYYGMKQDALLVQVTSLNRAVSVSGGVGDAVSDKSNRQRHAVQTYPKPIIPPEESEKIIHQIQKLMVENKSYLNPHYSLNDLCVQLHIPRRRLTFILNEVMGKNFYGLVNEYRMKEAIRIIEDSGKKYTIEAISEMVGFNSKSSFYACFRKYTGSSPKEYFEAK